MDDIIILSVTSLPHLTQLQPRFKPVCVLCVSLSVCRERILPLSSSLSSWSALNFTCSKKTILPTNCIFRSRLNVQMILKWSLEYSINQQPKLTSIWQVAGVNFPPCLCKVFIERLSIHVTNLVTTPGAIMMRSK